MYTYFLKMTKTKLPKH